MSANPAEIWIRYARADMALTEREHMRLSDAEKDQRYKHHNSRQEPLIGC